ncbi:hypothetical protein VNO77_14152 [Canavalia gladiata]|uniref:Gnk2-homologous domain-containing protein n=1 Tax=Canavalia gladiata TaxID=3824 RepID=A0AAN9QQV2_CANGL
MESTHVISIANGEENIAPKKSNKTFQFSLPLPPLFSRLRENKIHFSLVPITSLQKKDTRNIIHSIKVGVSLVLVSLLYLLDPLYEQVGENAMWAIMTVVVIFEFSAGATLGKGLNRGMGTILGAGLGCMAAVLAQNLGGVSNLIIIGASVFIFGTIATYFRQLASIKKRYDYGVMIFILTFNLVVVSGVRTHDQNVWEIARERLSTILMGFIVCVCVNLLVFPLWASDELHHSTVSRFQHLANSFQGCMEEYVKLGSEKENKPGASFTVCKSLLDTKSKDELLANFAKWEPWHGKFGFSYPWEKYLKIGEVLRELAAIILALGCCLEGSREPIESAQVSERAQLVTIGSQIAWSLRELGESLKQMRKCETESEISRKLKAAREELRLVIWAWKIGAIEKSSDAVEASCFVFLLKEVVEKVEELSNKVVEVGDVAGFRPHSTLQLRFVCCAYGVLLRVFQTPTSLPFYATLECTLQVTLLLTVYHTLLKNWRQRHQTENNYDYYNISPYPDAFAYGHAACNLNLTPSDCETCLGVAKTVMFSACPRSIGVRTVLHDCTIRYEQYPFDD